MKLRIIQSITIMLFLVGCSTAKIDTSNFEGDVVDLVGELSIGYSHALDKLIAMASNKKAESDLSNTLRTQFIPFEKQLFYSYSAIVDHCQKAGNQAKVSKDGVFTFNRYKVTQGAILWNAMVYEFQQNETNKYYLYETIRRYYHRDQYGVIKVECSNPEGDVVFMSWIAIARYPETPRLANYIFVAKRVSSDSVRFIQDATSAFRQATEYWEERFELEYVVKS